MTSRRPAELRVLLSGGDRRGIARSAVARRLIEAEPARVRDLVALTSDPDWLVVQRALDLLEKLAHDQPAWVAPYKTVFLGSLADDEHWEVRLQIVRALPLFRWSAAQARRVEAILRENVNFPQTFVRAWALNSLALLAKGRPRLGPLVRRHLREFGRSDSKALQARARAIKTSWGQRSRRSS